MHKYSGAQDLLPHRALMLKSEFTIEDIHYYMTHHLCLKSERLFYLHFVNLMNSAQK